MGPIRASSYYCPQSEPVKRKVYAGSATYGRIQKSLGERHVVLRNSDGDTATDDTGMFLIRAGQSRKQNTSYTKYKVSLVPDSIIQYILQLRSCR